AAADAAEAMRELLELSIGDGGRVAAEQVLDLCQGHLPNADADESRDDEPFAADLIGEVEDGVDVGQPADGVMVLARELGVGGEHDGDLAQLVEVREEDG